MSGSYQSRRFPIYCLAFLFVLQFAMTKPLCGKVLVASQQLPGQKVIYATPMIGYRSLSPDLFALGDPTVGKSAIPGLDSWGKSSIISPCESPWNPNGVICEAEPNKEMVITGELNLDLLQKKRKRGVAPTLKDRRPELYK